MSPTRPCPECGSESIEPLNPLLADQSGFLCLACKSIWFKDPYIIREKYPHLAPYYVPIEKLAELKNKRVEPIKVAERADALPSMTYKTETGFGNLFVTITYNDEKPFEIFAWVGKAGSEAMGLTEALCKAASWLLRAGIHPRDIVKLWKGIKGDRPHGFGENAIYSIPDGIAKILEKDCVRIGLLSGKEQKFEYTYTANVNLCPQCGAALKIEGRCEVCAAGCGYTTCP